MRSLRGLSFRVLPRGCIFSLVGPAIFVPNDDPSELLCLLAVLNSRAFKTCADAQMSAAMYQVGTIQHTPIPVVSIEARSELANLARRAWSLKRALDTHLETSHSFALPALLQVKDGTLADRATAWTEHIREVETEVDAIHSEIDGRCFDLYRIDEADRRAIADGFGSRRADAREDSEADVDSDAENGTDEPEKTPDDATSLSAQLASWAVGVAFGRFDVRLATGERPPPTEPEPFDALPVSSPALLTGDNGVPLSSAPGGYPVTLPVRGLLVDDPGHRHDLTATIRGVFDVVFGLDSDARWNEAATLLDPKDRNLRKWLTSGFFEHHLKCHSKSRRKAPIVWQLATPSSSYSVWLYAHRLTNDSFFQVQNDLVGQKLVHEERKLLALVQTTGANATASQRKEIAAQEILVEELRAMLDEVKRIAPLWKPDLEDGVVLTMAPLCRLVPQHKPWQKELKIVWDALCAGKYDWAHLAMHLWPERVVPKCMTDRSLAIAHGLEDVLLEGSHRR